MSLLALPLVRLISPLHVPSLANCLQLGPAAIWTASCPVRLRRVSPGAKTPPGQPEIFGGAPQYTKPPPQPSIAPYTHSRPPPPPPAASVHSLLWIVWTKTPSPAAVAPAPEAPVNYPLPPAAPSAPSVPPVPLTRAPTPYQSRPIRVPSLASTPSSPVFGPFRAPIQDPIPPPSATRETTFPIFNRKAGLCGRWLPGFRTFSTAVDSTVDNLVAPPANQRSLPSERGPPSPPAQAKPLHFASPSSHHACGKSMCA